MASDIFATHVNDDKIYLFKGDLDRSFHIFDRSGKFLFNIDKSSGKQRGPGTYYRVDDFLVDESNDMIELIDNLQKRIFKYDNGTGAFIESVNTSQPYKYFYKLEDDQYVYRSNAGCQNSESNFIHFSGSTNGEKESYHLIPDYLCNLNITDNKPFYPASNGELLYTERYNNVIYSVSENGVDPKYIVQASDVWPPKESLQNLARTDMSDKITVLNNELSNYVTKFSFIADYENHLLYTFSYRGGYYWNFYDKKNQKNKSYVFHGIDRAKPNEINLGFRFVRPVCRYKDYLVFGFQPYQILNYFETLSADIRAEITADPNNNFTQLVNNLDRNDNPVLIFAKLKPEFL